MQEVLQSLKLTLLNIGYAKLDTSWDYDNVISPFTRMYYITKGTAKVFHSNRVFDLKPGYLYLIPSYTYGRYRCDAYHEQYYISFLEEVKNGQSIYSWKDFVYEIRAVEKDAYFFSRLLELNPRRFLMDEDPKVYDNEPTLKGFVKRNEELSTKSYIETHGILNILLSRFIQNSGKSSYNSPSLKNGLNDVRNYIGQNLHQSLTISRLANFCNLSPDYFSRIFKEHFGIRPSIYLQSKRIERAQLLLLTTNNSLKEIAEKTGMGTISYFSRIFKKHTGKTPGKFRRERLTV